MPTTATKLLYADVLAHHKFRQQLPASFGHEQHRVSRLWRTLVSSYTAPNKQNRTIVCPPSVA
ncbi:hypothetical protein V8E51_017656 [Hyaloscypha variabilis]